MWREKQRSESGPPDRTADFPAKLILIERRFLDSVTIVEETVGSERGVLVVFVESSVKRCPTSRGDVRHLDRAATAQRRIRILRQDGELGNVVDTRTIRIEIAFANEVILDVQTIARDVLR